MFINWTDQLSNFRTQYFKYLFKINKQQPHIWGKTTILPWLQAVPCVTIQHSTAARPAWKRQSHSLFWQTCPMMIVVSTGLFGPLSTCDLWMAQLIGGYRKAKGIWFDRGTKFYDSDGFLTSIFPNHSSEAWTKIIWYRLCFYHNTWHQDNHKNKKKTVAARVALCYVLLNRTCIFIFCWMEESQIYTWICLPSDSFVSLGKNFFFFPQDSCGCVWGV